MSDDLSLKCMRALPGTDRKNDPDNQWGSTGTFDFPCEHCGKKVMWGRVRSNGHMRAACETLDCFAMMS